MNPDMETGYCETTVARDLLYQFDISVTVFGHILAALISQE